MSWIYALKDTYERDPLGVKVGYCGSSNGKRAWNAAPSYSPRPMYYLAGWRVKLPLVTATGGPFQKLRELERHLHGICKPQLIFPRNGTEWFHIEAAEAIARISDELRAEPTETNRHRNWTIINDDLRNPHPDSFLANRFKIVAWIYREHLTDRIKTQLIDDWGAPKLKQRRYSRNGFAEEAAFTYPGKVSGEHSMRLHSIWQQIMREFGPGPIDSAYGWLNEGTKVEDVVRFYSDGDLISLDITQKEPPPGVRRWHNRSEAMPTDT